MDNLRTASEELADAWISLSSSLWTGRLMEDLTFNEINILSILNKKKEDNVTATELCRYTGLLKSQMTRLLGSMEAKGYLHRVRATGDHRLVYIQMLPAGEAAFQAQREKILSLVDQVAAEMGAENALSAARQVRQVAQALRIVTAEEG